MPLKIIAGLLFIIWLGLVAVGKSGFVHLVLFVALGVAFVEALRIYRTGLRAPAKAEDRTLQTPTAS